MIGTKLLHYEITEKLGEGGMGVVYKARDTHLDRFVAIKVLPPERVADQTRKARFVQEAKAASALNHPNIVTIYDISADSGVDFIAMEYVAGKPLSRVIPRNGLRVTEALRIAAQVAGALASAHAAGILHRDLKPANIMVSDTGHVKLLDFGLAKLAEHAAPGEDSSTETAITEEGQIAGTAAYMSPEQAEGKSLDARSDIFAFGAVLYEMLSGRRAFKGATTASTLSAVLRDEPEVLGGELPSEVRRLVHRALRKDRSKRFQTAADLKVALEELAEESSSGTLGEADAPARTGKRKTWIAAGAAVAGVAALAALWILRPEPPAALSVTRITHDSGVTEMPAISPDGKLIAYASDRAGGSSLDIWVQHRGGGQSIRITREPGSEFSPSFSPDGSQIVYSTLTGVYLVGSLGGESRLVAKGGLLPRFSPDGNQIACATSFVNVSRLFIVDVTGGTPRRVLPEFAYVSGPVWSPDGGRLMVLASRELGRKPGIWLVPLDGAPPESCADISLVPAQWLPGDRLLYAAGSQDAVDLYLARLSGHGCRLQGEPVRLTGGTGRAGLPSMARDGTMVLGISTVNTDLWSLPFDHGSIKSAGLATPLTQDAAFQMYPDISADGTRLVYTWQSGGQTEFRLMDTASKTTRPLMPMSDGRDRPIISRDGKRVAFLRGRAPYHAPSVWVLDLSDSGAPGSPREVFRGAFLWLWSWSPDNRGILLSLAPQPVSLGLLRPEEGRVEGLIKLENSGVWQGRLSPDGRWMVLKADALKVLPFRDREPAPESEWVEVARPGDLPRWSPDGNTIYYVAPHEGFRCIFAQRLDPARKTPVGGRIDVAHFHDARSTWPPYLDHGGIGLAVAPDRLVYSQADITGNIWLTHLDLERYR